MGDMTQLHSILAGATLLPLRLTFAISYGFGWLVLFSSSGFQQSELDSPHFGWFLD